MAAFLDTPSGYLLVDHPSNERKDNCDRDNPFNQVVEFNETKSESTESTESTLMSSVDGESNKFIFVNNTTEENASPSDVLLPANGETPDIAAAESSHKPPGKPNKKNLRVTFPEGDEVVSGYMDPPIPWDDVASCTTEKLVSAYLKSCEKFGVKPLLRLLSQLQAIGNFHERNETLTSRNDHLDFRHCETLEEVLRRVQFRTIDLEATRLDDEAAVVIFDMVEYYESCIKLNISFNRSFGARGWQACARLIRKASCLQQLDARGCNISEHLMPFMARALKIGTSLVSLHLENTLMSGKSLITLVMALKTNETLRELYLAENKLMPSDAMQLSSLIKNNKSIKLIDLRNNHLQDIGMGHLCEGIFEQGSSEQGLETLVVWNNHITYHSMNSLCRALMNTQSLLDLNLGRNNITNEGIHRLKDGLVKNKSLLRMRLQAIKISCEGAVAIAEFLAETQKLLRVDLRENEIKTGGLMALSLALKVNRSVVRVDLDKEPKKESGVKDYATQQKQLLVDIFSYIDRNSKLAAQREEDERVRTKLEEEKNREANAAGEDFKVEKSSKVSSRDDETSPVVEETRQVESPTSDDNFEVTEYESLSAPAPSVPTSVPSSSLNSNNSCRSKLHLDLQSSESSPSDAHVSVPGSPSTFQSPDYIPTVVPLSPMVLSHGTASLIPVKSDFIFSPLANSEECATTLESPEKEFGVSDISFYSTRSSVENVLCVAGDLIEQNVKVKKSGKMKRKKFIVTKAKLPGHHLHVGSSGKKPSGKTTHTKSGQKQMSSNSMADVISAIDQTANAITGAVSSQGSDGKVKASVSNSTASDLETWSEKQLNSELCPPAVSNFAQTLERPTSDCNSINILLSAMHSYEARTSNTVVPPLDLPLIQTRILDVSSPADDLMCRDANENNSNSPMDVGKFEGCTKSGGSIASAGDENLNESEKLLNLSVNGLLKVDIPDVS